MASLAEIRARLQEQQQKSSGNNQVVQQDHTIYAHWNIPEGTTTRIRYLPDADPNNPFFWVERAMINLEFSGIKGQVDSKPVTVKVPCMEMYGKGEVCPILTEVRQWFKDKSLEDMGRKYWKKRSYLFQGFVRENALTDDVPPENPIRRFVISPQIFNLVKDALMDPEMESLPTDYENGLDFNVKKTSKGGYADYGTSAYSRKETALTSTELEAIEKFGLFDLSSFLPRKPTAAELEIIKEMFEASVDGQPYDPEKWGSHFKPAGFQTSSGNTGSAARVSAPEVQAKVETVSDTVTDSDDLPFEPDEKVQAADSVVTPSKPSSQRAEDILAMIRNRQK